MATILTPVAVTGGNFLQMCQDLRAEAGLSGTGPASVLNQTGMSGMIVKWVRDAYSEVLKMHPWSFLWARVDSTPLVIGQATYLTTELGASDMGKIYRTKMFDITTPGINRINYVQWKTIDEATPTAGTPRYWSRRPDGKVVFAPVPDAAISIKLDYQRDGHMLINNTDTPLIPDPTLYKAIVMRALMYYALYDENMSAMQDADRQFTVLLSQMCERYVPQLIGTPLTLDMPENTLALELV